VWGLSSGGHVDPRVSGREREQKVDWTSLEAALVIYSSPRRKHTLAVWWNCNSAIAADRRRPRALGRG